MLRFIKISLLLFATLYGSHVYSSATEELTEKSKVSLIPLSEEPIVFPKSGLTYHPKTQTFTGPFFEGVNDAKGVQSKLVRAQEKLASLKANLSEDKLIKYSALKMKISRWLSLTDQKREELTDTDEEKFTAQDIDLYYDFSTQEAKLPYLEIKINFYQSIIDICQQELKTQAQVQTRALPSNQVLSSNQVQELKAFFLERGDTFKKVWHLERSIQSVTSDFKNACEMLGELRQRLKTQAQVQTQAQSSNQ